MEDDDEEIDLDDIDYEQLDPQIRELAQQMGMHPKEVLKQLMQNLKNEEGNNEEDGGDNDQQDDEDDQEGYGMEDDEQQANFEEQQRQEQLRREKELFKQ